MNHTYLRGDMYYADLGQGIGSEQEGYRPVVIIQNNVGNRHSPTVIIASITSKKDAKPKLPTHYYIHAENGLELPSIVLLEQLRTVDKRRLGDFIGRSYPPRGLDIMEAVFHMGKESNQHLREFSEKRADFAVRELRDYGADELKALLRILRIRFVNIKNSEISPNRFPPFSKK